MLIGWCTLYKAFGKQVWMEYASIIFGIIVKWKNQW